MTGFWYGRVFDPSVYSHHKLPFAVDYGDTNIMKEARMGIINKNVKHRVGDRVIAVDIWPTSDNGKEHTISAVKMMPHGKQWVALDGNTNPCYFAWRFEKKVAPRQFQVGDIVRRTGFSNCGAVLGQEYRVTRVAHTGDQFPGLALAGVSGRIGDGTCNGRHFELVTAVEDLPKPVEPKVTVTKRYMTDATVFDSDSDTRLVIGYDQRGRFADSGPCIDFEVQNVKTQFNGIDIEDLETLDAVIRVLTGMREMFVNDTKAGG